MTHPWRGRQCTRSNCTRVADTDGLCQPHYHMAVAAGLNGLVDSGPVLEHIAKLRAVGWTHAQIGAACGVRHERSAQLERRRFPRVRARTAREILAIEVEPSSSKLSLTIRGTRRRLEALRFMGWPTHKIACLAGLHAKTLYYAVYRGTASADTVLRVANVYRELCNQRGPSNIIAARAKTTGLIPPWAWDDIDHDEKPPQPDSSSEPDLIAVERCCNGRLPWIRLRSIEKIIVLQRMANSGLSDPEIARRVQASITTVNQGRLRHGIPSGLLRRQAA